MCAVISATQGRRIGGTWSGLAWAKSKTVSEKLLKQKGLAGGIA
jgi:hypothetical protein